MWQHHFGKGLVNTPGNFGKMGAPPTNQPLLDWLATEFVRQGWDMKSIHRLIMTSSVYRQSSRADGARLEKDPDATLLSPFPAAPAGFGRNSGFPLFESGRAA